MLERHLLEVITITAPVSGTDWASVSCVAGSRREIHHQAVQLAPFHIREELAHRARDHRPAPDHRRVPYR